MNVLQRLLDWVSGGESIHPLAQTRIQPEPYSRPDTGSEPLPDAVEKRVLAITHNPVLQTQGGKTVKEVFGWNNPHELAAGYAQDVREASDGYANYVVVEHLEVDEFPVKADGYCYTEESYLTAWQQRRFHDPDLVDYLALVRKFNLIERVSDGEIDEVWLFGHPYGGYYESIMCGPGAFWCNAPALAGTEHAARRFVMMGFNFERGVGEMLEDLGHRVESMMQRVWADVPDNANLWQRFIRYDKTHPGRAECGNVHFAPNSQRDYDWGNHRTVMSNCDDWLHYPDLTGDRFRPVNCGEWGNGRYSAASLVVVVALASPRRATATTSPTTGGNTSLIRTRSSL